jgi:hypothetical protein
MNEIMRGQVAASSGARLHAGRTFLAAAGLTLALTAGIAACGGGEPEAIGPQITRSMAGDTVVVRTESGSVWGIDGVLVPEVSIGQLEGDLEYLFGNIASLGVGPDGTIYVVDRQVPDLRAFSADGTFLHTLGRPGEGPGEINQPDGGLAVLSDGRVLVRDVGNARIQVYDPAGEPAGAWSIRGGFSTSSPLYKDRDDNVYTQILVDPRAEVKDWVVGLVRISPDGVVGDTLTPPKSGFENPAVEAHSMEDGKVTGTSRNGVPFAATTQTTFHPGGYWIQGVSTDYRFALKRPGSPVIIERVAERVPVTSAEKAEDEYRLTMNMRQTEPGWRWNGPPIPDVKPAFGSILAGRDGRIWVQVPQPGVEGDDPDYDPKDQRSTPNRWKEPLAFDVFEEDGTYLGRVHPPEGFQLYPTPVFDGEYVWAVVEDDLGVERVARYHLTVARADVDGGGS